MRSFSPLPDFRQTLSTGGAAVVGITVLGWLRPPRAGMTASQAMLLFSAIGMVVGLLADSRATQLSSLTSLCSVADRNLWSIVLLHWTLLPWMHIGMWVGGFGAIPLARAMRPADHRPYCVRLAESVACSAWMTAGMSCGVLVAEYLVSQSGTRSLPLMLGAMFSGMAGGMTASAALYRMHSRRRPMSEVWHWWARQ